MGIPNRKNLRLAGYDYGEAGTYFVTICTDERKRCLSVIPVGAGVLDGPTLRLTKIGEIVRSQIIEIDHTYDDVSIQKYVIMPNHVHLLISIAPQSVTNGPSRTPAPTNKRLPQIISTLKRLTNRAAGASIWQRSYHDHIIRDDSDYLAHWRYIDDNPAKWEEDKYYVPE